jgi:hypothetical protein
MKSRARSARRVRARRRIKRRRRRGGGKVRRSGRRAGECRLYRYNSGDAGSVSIAGRK